MDVLTIILIVMQAIVGASHGIDKIHKHVKKRKKQKVEQVIKQTVEVNCDNGDNNEEEN